VFDLAFTLQLSIKLATETSVKKILNDATDKQELRQKYSVQQDTCSSQKGSVYKYHYDTTQMADEHKSLPAKKREGLH